MRLTLPIHPHSTSPLREGLVFAGLTLALSWLFWLPGAFLRGALGDLLLAIGSFAPLAVAIFLDIWFQESSFKPLNWWKTLTARRIVLAAFLPLVVLAPVLMLRFEQGTLELGDLFADARAMWLSLVGLLVLACAEEIGWRAYLLPRLKQIPLYVTNLFIGLLWFLWQLPLIVTGRYNTSENFNTFLVAMFLYALLITPFFNRVALRADYNPILPTLVRAGLIFLIALYLLQGRADPLTDTFGALTIGWLLLLNLVLFSQLWLGKRPPAEISELERVMPLGAGN